MLEIKIGAHEKFVANSRKIETKVGTKYFINTKFVGTKGSMYSGYFGIIILNKEGKEIERRIKWLNDISGAEKNIRLVFKAPTEQSLVIYRFNTETPTKSDCQYQILPIEQVSVSHADPDTDEDFELLEGYKAPRPTELTSEQELILEKNIVWLFGSARSGTTWLGTQLLSHNTLIMSEPHITNHIGFRNWGVKDRVARHIDLRSKNPDYFFSKMYQNTWMYFLRKLILNRIYSQFLDLTHTIVIKEPMGIGASDIISKCMPHSKIIILLRDGRDVIDSQIDAIRDDTSWATIRTGTTPLDPNKIKETIEEYAKSWTSLIDNLMNTYENHAQDKLLLLRYEKLRRDTVEELQRIYKFLEIKIQKNEIENIVSRYSFENIPASEKGSGKFTRFASPGKWKEDFNDSEKTIMEKIMGNTLRRLEY